MQNYLQHSKSFKGLTPKNWTFVAYDDAGESWRNTSSLRCHCGKLLRYRYTFKYIGDLSVIDNLLDADKEDVRKQNGIVYFGETCFNHKILGLSNEQSNNLVTGIKTIRQQALRYLQNDETLKKALEAQRHLIKLLGYNKISFPGYVNELDQMDLPINREQMGELQDLYEAHVQTMPRPRSSVRYRNLEEIEITPRPNSILQDDPLTAELFLQRYGAIEAGKEVSALELAYEIDVQSPNHYGYYSSGKPYLYSEIVLYLDNEQRRGNVIITNKGWDDILFKKRRDA
ncbi:MAG: hypothetical protein K0Q87_193 [Neobacillus sp.]|jgi:hypothetical protein|nr:hypothetical protein [Neobacillus sp.]